MIKGSIVVLAALVAAFAACRSPLDIDTIRTHVIINYDSVAQTLHATKDTIFATVEDERISFSYMIERSIGNRKFANLYYISVQATSNDLTSLNYSRLSLRLDAIGDTGVYTMNAYFSNLKKVDSNTLKAAPEYSALLERRERGAAMMFRTGDPRSHGEVHIVKIDTVNKIIAGTFHFVGYNTEDGYIKEVHDGVFRLTLPE
jgi:hypothetical protein